MTGEQPSKITSEKKEPSKTLPLRLHLLKSVLTIRESVKFELTDTKSVKSQPIHLRDNSKERRSFAKAIGTARSEIRSRREKRMVTLTCNYQKIRHPTNYAIRYKNRDQETQL